MKGELERRIREATKVYSQEGHYIGVKELQLHDVLDINAEARKEFLMLEQRAREQASKMIKTGLSGRLPYYRLFLNVSIKLMLAWFHKYFGGEE